MFYDVNRFYSTILSFMFLVCLTMVLIPILALTTLADASIAIANETRETLLAP